MSRNAINTTIGALVPTHQNPASILGGNFSLQSEIEHGVGTGIGAAAGAILYKKHRVLGGIGGAVLGRNLSALADAGTRRDALCNLGIAAAAILGALYMPKRPVIGFGAGGLAAGLAVHYGKLRG